jgi:hypothetical protein
VEEQPGITVCLHSRNRAPHRRGTLNHSPSLGFQSFNLPSAQPPQHGGGWGSLRSQGRYRRGSTAPLLPLALPGSGAGHRSKAGRATRLLLGRAPQVVFALPCQHFRIWGQGLSSRNNKSHPFAETCIRTLQFHSFSAQPCGTGRQAVSLTEGSFVLGIKTQGKGSQKQWDGWMCHGLTVIQNQGGKD